jgi:hypothetical protein
MPNHLICFSFPVNKPATCQQWIDYCAKHISTWFPSSRSRLCSEHFDSNCIRKKFLTTHLKEGSVPTIPPLVRNYDVEFMLIVWLMFISCIINSYFHSYSCIDVIFFSVAKLVPVHLPSSVYFANPIS